MLNHEYPPLGGGASPVTRAIARELVERGDRVDVITMGRQGLPPFEEDDGVRVHRVHCLRSEVHLAHGRELATWIASALVKGSRLADREHFDLVHSHFFVPCGVVARWLKQRYGIPYVITAHGTDVPGYNPDRFRGWHRLLAPHWRGIQRGASAITSPSESLARLIREGAGQPLEIEVIPNGIREDWIEPGEKEPILLVVSRLFERKGVQHLLRALAGTPLGFDVHVVGDGPYLPELHRLARDVPDHVEFHGWMDNGCSALRDLYRRAAIFAFPSTAENFPISLLEAMLAGCAITATGINACREVLGDTARLFDPGDEAALREHLVALSGSAEERVRLGTSARQRVLDRFTWSRLGGRYHELFASLVESRAVR